MRVAVVGGGIAGLAAAWELSGRHEVSVLEPGRLGGCVLTTDFGGYPVDEGPDAFLTRVPGALELCSELGIDGELVAPAAGSSSLWIGGSLRRLPEGLVLGVPSDLPGLVRSRVMSAAGILRAALDLVLPASAPGDDVSVRDLVARRMGRQAADRLVDPLVGGIHAGWTGELGAAEVTPQLLAAARRSRSLLVGLRGGPRPEGPAFLAPLAGMGRLVEALVTGLAGSGVTFVPLRAEQVRTLADARVAIEPDGGIFDAAVLATPGHVTADLLGPGGGAEALRAVPRASVALVTASIVLDRGGLPEGLNGFLVPRGEGRLMTACSFGSSKWPHWSDGTPVVRLSAGRHRDERVIDMDDALLADRLLDELGEALGAGIEPKLTRVSRWDGAFPQYLPGHGALVERVDAEVRRQHPNVALAGSTYRGSGLPACISSGRRAAMDVAR